MPRVLNSCHPTRGHVSIFIGIKASAQTLKLPKNNTWVFPSYDLDTCLEDFLNSPESFLDPTNEVVLSVMLLNF